MLLVYLKQNKKKYKNNNNKKKVIKILNGITCYCNTLGVCQDRRVFKISVAIFLFLQQFSNLKTSFEG